MTLVHFAVMPVVGAATFSALGRAITGFIPDADASAPIVNAAVVAAWGIAGLLLAVRFFSWERRG